MKRFYVWLDLVNRGHPYSRQHTARLEDKGRFPRRRQLGPNRVAWLADEVDRHWDECPEGPLPIRVTPRRKRAPDGEAA